MTPSLDLDFTLPLAEHGEYALAGRLDFNDNRLSLPDWDVQMTNIRGALDFTLDGLKAEGIAARDWVPGGGRRPATGRRRDAGARAGILRSKTSPASCRRCRCSSPVAAPTSPSASMCRHVVQRGPPDTAQYR